MVMMLGSNRMRTAVSIFLRVIILWLIAAGLVMFTQKSFAQQATLTITKAVKKQARILVVSSQRVEIRTDLNAPILEIPYGEGQNFAQGDILIKYDCARYDAERKAAQAFAHASNIEHRTKRKLFKYQAVGRDEMQLAAAQSAKANAELKVHQVRAVQCEYKAPFSGRIVNQHVKAHEFPATDKPLLTILNDTQLELHLVAPSKWLRWLKTGQSFQFKIDETGQTHTGKIDRLGAEVDPVSQTIKLIGKFTNSPDRILAGMSGTAYFQAGS